MQDEDVFEVIEIDSWDHLKKALMKRSFDYYFRGQLDSDWDLKSSLERTEEEFKSLAESNMLRIFDQHLYTLGLKNIPETKVEKLMLMQHYGAPTRLIDFTESPYVAAFFALNKKTDGLNSSNNKSSIYAINGSSLYTRLTVFGDEEYCRFFDDKKIKVANIYSELIKPRIFDELILGRTIQSKFVTVIKPIYHHERSNSQASIHLSAGNIDYSFLENFRNLLDNSGDIIEKTEPLAVKYIFPNSIREEALPDLNLMNINFSSLFPGIEGFMKDLYFRHESFDYSKKMIFNRIASKFEA